MWCGTARKSTPRFEPLAAFEVEWQDEDEEAATA
jgi:hypothetical protein